MAKKKIDLNLARQVTSIAHFDDSYKDEMKGVVVKKISIDFLKENPYQPRISMNDIQLQNLANSIKEEGLLQPITVSQKNDQEYIIIYGHRRVAASKLIDLKLIDAIVLKEVDHDQLAILPLIENLQREDMDPIETALSMKKIIDEKIVLNQETLAKKLGFSKSWISRTMSLIKLPEEVLKQVKQDGYRDIIVLSSLNKLKSGHLEVFKKVVTLDRGSALKYIKMFSEKAPMAYVDNRLKITKNIININTKGLSTTKKDQVRELIEKIKSILND